MKKHVLLSVLCLLCLICLCLSSLSGAGEAGYGVRACSMTGYITQSGVNIRSGPGTGHDRYGKAERGDMIRIVSSTLDGDGAVWYYGEINGISGWVSAAYVTASLPPAPTPAPTVGTGWQIMSLSFPGTVSADRANVRSRAGMDGTVTAVLEYGTPVTIRQANADSSGIMWYLCEYAPGQSGFIRSDLIRVTPYAPTEIPIHVFPVSFTGYTNASAVNVRNAPDGTRIARLDRGTDVRVTGEVYFSSATWYRVTWSGGTGYIRSDLISRTTPAPATAVPTPYLFTETPLSFTAAVLKDKCNVRSLPAYGADILFRVDAGDILSVRALCTDGEGNLWYRAETAGGRSGYILADLVTSAAAGSLPPDTGTSEGGSFLPPDTGYVAAATLPPDTGYEAAATLPRDTGYEAAATLPPDTGYEAAATLPPDAGYGAAATLPPDTGYAAAATLPPDAGYEAAATLPPDAGYEAAPEESVPPAAAPTPEPGPSPTPSPTDGPTPEPTPGHAFVTSGPTVRPAEGKEEVPILDFGAYVSSPGQTLSVYTAPSAVAWRADGGSASVVTGDNLWCAGSDGEWLLILYNNADGDVRTGYIRALSLRGVMPEAEPLSFANVEAVLLSSAVMTSDPIGRSDGIVTLRPGDRVTLLATCLLGDTWAYAETTVGGMPARGFVPLGSLSK